MKFVKRTFTLNLVLLIHIALLSQTKAMNSNILYFQEGNQIEPTNYILFDNKLDSLYNAYETLINDESISSKVKKQKIKNLLKIENATIIEYKKALTLEKNILTNKCESILKDSTSTLLNENQELFEQAHYTFSEAEKLNTIAEKIEDTKESQQTQIEVIEKIKTGINSLHKVIKNAPSKKTITSKPIIVLVSDSLFSSSADSTKITESEITQNEDSITLIKNQVIPSDQPNVKKYAIQKDSESRINYLNQFDKTSLINFWENYRNSSSLSLPQKATIEDVIAKNDTTISDRQPLTKYNQPHKQELVEKSTENIPSEKLKLIEDHIESNKSSSDTEKKTQLNNISSKEELEIIKHKNIQTDQIEFWVQIAASQKPLNQNTLLTIYKGSSEITLREEEGWYKYQINKSEEFKTALQHLENAHVNDAFIVAYLGSQKLSLLEVLHPKKLTPLPIKKDSSIIYYIQIMATKKQLSLQKQATLFAKEYQIREVVEDGLFKYQIEGTNQFKTTLKYLQQQNISDAFIVPYQGDQKLLLKDAIKLTDR